MRGAPGRFTAGTGYTAYEARVIVNSILEGEAGVSNARALECNLSELIAGAISIEQFRKEFDDMAADLSDAELKRSNQERRDSSGAV